MTFSREVSEQSMVWWVSCGQKHPPSLMVE